MEFGLSVYVNDEPLVESLIVAIEAETNHLLKKAGAFLRIKLHNHTNYLYDLSEWRFGLISPSFVSDVKGYSEPAHTNRIDLSESRLFMLNQIKGNLLPDEWRQYVILLESEPTFPRGSFNFSLKIFGNFGPKEYPFSILI